MVLPCGGGSGEQTLGSTITATVPAAGYAESTGTYTLSGAGKMDNSNSYNFSFKYTTLSGDFTFTARLLSQGGTGDGGRAGIAALEGLSGTPIYAWTARYASSGEIRAAINGNAKASLSGFASSTPPVWVRVQRRGNALYSAASNDGLVWVEKSNASVTAAALQVGLALSSGANGTVVAADFDNVSIVGGGR